MRAEQVDLSHVKRDGGIASRWPLCEQGQHFDLGHILSSAVIDSVSPARLGELGVQHAGLWECDLLNSSLTWSGGVYDLFGLERERRITREQALAHYTEDSRVRLERLRSDAIRHKCGFTIDVEIRAAAVGQMRKVRLIGAPVYAGELAIRLHGLKLII
ncbi:MAG TPA: hypothetical protein VGU01_05815 [Sphingomicrobium sp.]|nr:hypothetical protein [Sphingomicrobium sp.]